MIHGIQIPDAVIHIVQINKICFPVKGKIIFSLLDEDSDLLELAPGDNLLKATADSGETSLQVTVRFYPMVSGILPEVIS